MAAQAIGNTELEEKFGKSLEMLERPNTVVFNPSYVFSLSLSGWDVLTCIDCICNLVSSTTWHAHLLSLSTLVASSVSLSVLAGYTDDLIPSEQSSRPIS